MAVCCQNLPLGAISSRSALSMLVGELFKKFGLYLNTAVFEKNIDILKFITIIVIYYFLFHNVVETIN